MRDGLATLGLLEKITDFSSFRSSVGTETDLVTLANDFRRAIDRENVFPLVILGHFSGGGIGGLSYNSSTLSCKADSIR